MGSIILEGIGKSYGSASAVKDFNLTVPQGEFVTILGPSGSGKTTVLSLVAGLIRPSAGRILIGGRDVTQLRPQERQIGLVFQSYALFPHLDVFHNVAFPLTVRGLDKCSIEAKVSAALARVRLTGFEHRKPTQLSGGQQQRVALARAFVFEPEILLLDEPLGALDRKLREEVQVELKSLQRDLGITTLLVTHDQEEALSLSDRIVILSGGQTQQIASPIDAYRHPANEFVASFLGQANRLSGTIVPNGVHLRNGTVVPGCLQGRSLGERVVAIIRPERIKVVRPEEGLAVSLRQVVYLGHGQRWHFTDSDGHELIGAVPNETEQPPLGTSIGLTWSADDAWLVSEQP